MTTNRQLADFARKVRYDLTAAQAKLTDLIDALEGANVQLAEPLPARVQIERQIRNGVLTDPVELEAELRAAGALTESDRSELRGLLVGVEA